MQKITAGLLFPALLASAALWTMSTTAYAQDEWIAEYTTSGATVNPLLVTAGLNVPEGIAVSGSDVFVANYGTGTIGEYTTSGATVNASLITGLNGAYALAVSGSNLFVTSGFGLTATIGEYTTSGATVNAARHGVV